MDQIFADGLYKLFIEVHLKYPTKQSLQHPHNFERGLTLRLRLSPTTTLNEEGG